MLITTKGYLSETEYQTFLRNWPPVLSGHFASIPVQFEHGRSEK